MAGTASLSGHWWTGVLTLLLSMRFAIATANSASAATVIASSGNNVQPTDLNQVTEPASGSTSDPKRSEDDICSML